MLVIIDPIDGSTNAKRGLPHHSLSIAVADGPTMADVAFGYVYDFGPGGGVDARGAARARCSTACGSTRDGAERRTRDGKLELLGDRVRRPALDRDAADELVEAAHRLRALGTIAVTLCQVAAARLDGMVTLRRSRAVDAAAGQLIVREAGGVVAFPAATDLGAPLDMEPRSPIVAARTARRSSSCAASGGWRARERPAASLPEALAHVPVSRRPGRAMRLRTDVRRRASVDAVIDWRLADTVAKAVAATAPGAEGTARAVGRRGRRPSRPSSAGWSSGLHRPRPRRARCRRRRRSTARGWAAINLALDAHRCSTRWPTRAARASGR